MYFISLTIKDRVSKDHCHCSVYNKAFCKKDIVAEKVFQYLYKKGLATKDAHTDMGVIQGNETSLNATMEKWVVEYKCDQRTLMTMMLVPDFVARANLNLFEAHMYNFKRL